MSTYASDTGGGKDFDPVPEGTHFAVCDMFVDLGKQDSKFGVKPKIYIRWQIPKLRVSYEKDGQTIEAPMAIGSKFTLSLAEKSSLRPLLQSWRGRAFTPEELKRFDVTTILGKPCMISVTHAPKEGGGVYANVSAVAKLPDGMEAPTLEGEAILYDADNQGTYEKLRPWMQEAIKAAISDQHVATDDPDAWRNNPLDDDVPF